MLCISLGFRSRDDSRDGIGKKKANHTKSIAFHNLASVILAYILGPLFLQYSNIKKKNVYIGMPNT